MVMWVNMNECCLCKIIVIMTYELDMLFGIKMYDSNST